MAIHIDKATRQRINYMKHSGDFEYDQSGDDAISREDVPLTGPWEDYTGSGGVDSRTLQHWSCTENTLQGQDPNITNNAKLPNLSVIGTRTGTHRRRIRRVYVNPGN